MNYLFLPPPLLHCQCSQKRIDCHISNIYIQYYDNKNLNNTCDYMVVTITQKIIIIKSSRIAINVAIKNHIANTICLRAERIAAI